MGIFNDIDIILEANQPLLTEATNDEVVTKFIYDDFAKTRAEFANPQKWSKIWGSSNVKISILGGDRDGVGNTGATLTFYGTPILFKDNDGGIYYTKTGEGTTYTKLYKLIDGILATPPTDTANTEKWNEIKDSIREVDEDTMESLLKGESIPDEDSNKESEEDQKEPKDEESDELSTPEETETPEETKTEEQESEEEKTPEDEEIDDIESNEKKKK